MPQNEEKDVKLPASVMQTLVPLSKYTTTAPSTQPVSITLAYLFKCHISLSASVNKKGEKLFKVELKKQY